MATKLIVKKEFLESEIHFGKHGSSYKVILKSATQEELAGLKETGDFDHLFETKEK